MQSSQNHWYTIEYDENSVAWLVDDKKARVCLEHGMRVYVAAWAPPAYAARQEEPAHSGEETPA